MAIDLGVAFGSAIKSGVGTYTALQDQAQKDLQTKRLQQQMTEEDGYRLAQKEISAERLTGGTAVGDVVQESTPFYDTQQKEQLTTALKGMTPEQQQAALRSFAPVEQNDKLAKIGVYEAPDGRLLASNERTSKSAMDKQRELIERMQSEGNMYGQEKALQMKSIVRQSDLDDRFDKFFNSTQDTQKTLQKAITDNGLSGVPNAVNTDLKKYGMSAKFVSGKGAGYIDVIQGGKSVGRYTDGDSIVKAVTQAKFSVFNEELVGLMGSADKAASFMTQQYGLKQRDRQIAIQERAVAAKEKAAGTTKLGTPIPLFNPETNQTGLMYPGKPGAVFTLDGKQIPDPKGFLSNAIATSQINASNKAETKDRLFIGPNGENATMNQETKQLERPDGTIVENAQMYKSVGSAPSKSKEAYIQQTAAELLKSAAETDPKVAATKAEQLWNLANPTQATKGSAQAKGNSSPLPDSFGAQLDQWFAGIRDIKNKSAKQTSAIPRPFNENSVVGP
jgi:hypothetical protein